jgi:hypothetical protein
MFDNTRFRMLKSELTPVEDVATTELKGHRKTFCCTDQALESLTQHLLYTGCEILEDA